MKFLSLICVFCLPLVIGCGLGSREEQIEVKPQTDPLKPVKDMLERYVRGEPVGSEATSFDYMVNELRKADPAKADEADKAFKAIVANPNNRVNIAKEALKKLQ
ncbi:MAG: hypothetical protein R3B84_08455 [Zavarzinella sp.]